MDQDLVQAVECKVESLAAQRDVFHANVVHLLHHLIFSIDKSFLVNLIEVWRSDEIALGVATNEIVDFRCSEVGNEC
jgi:hypothetical protein